MFDTGTKLSLPFDNFTRDSHTQEMNRDFLNNFNEAVAI